MTEHENGVREAHLANRAFWDEVAPVHYKSYALDELRNGGVHIDAFEQEEVGPVAGKRLLHLQCHIGSDTLSWARLGAEVTGVDFSPESIRIARQLSEELDLPARFIESDVYAAREVLSDSFDIVYSSRGAICWLSDLDRWAQTAASFLEQGGRLYLQDTHPFLCTFGDEEPGPLEIHYPYFSNGEPERWEGDNDYSDMSYKTQHPTYEWTWTVSDILGAVIGAGLRLEFFHEFDRLFFPGLPGMEKAEDGWYVLPGYEGMIPMTFSLRAVKEGVQ
jgi:SAM-dependent methyltransferase